MHLGQRFLISIAFRFLFAAILFGTASSACVAGNYKFLKSVSIGGEGGWDCLTVDPDGRRLYVTHASKIIVLDTEQDKVVGEITDTTGVHAIAIASDLGRGYSSNGAESSIGVIDLKSLNTITKLKSGENPDAILYEPSAKEVFAFNGRSRSVTIINASSQTVAGEIALPGKPEFAAADSEHGVIFCNIEDKSQVVVIDTRKRAVRQTWPLAPGEEPTGIAFDSKHRRLFVTCHNKLMEMLDSETGKILASVPIGSGVDGCAFDPTTGLVFASCGDGTMTIAKEEPPGQLKVIQTLTTERGARTLALDSRTHRIYSVTAQFAPETSTPTPGQRSRPNFVPGTFHLLVFGPE
jgi:DNA-binding beta-propeller fold protein YncE